MTDRDAIDGIIDLEYDSVHDVYYVPGHYPQKNVEQFSVSSGITCDLYDERGRILALNSPKGQYISTKA